MIKKLIAVTFMFLFVALPVMAQDDATSSAIKEKIKERLDQNATGSAQNSNQDTSKTVYYAWVGTLTKVDQDSLVVKTDNGDKQAKFDSKTTIVQNDKGTARKEIKPEKLKIGNFVIAIGTLNNDVIKTVRISSSPATTNASTKKVVFGKVAEIEDAKVTLQNDEKTILTLDTNTTLLISGMEKPKAVDIQLEDKVYAVVLVKDGNIIETSSVFVIPGKYNPQTKQFSPTPQAATESGKKAVKSPSPSPKASAEE
jgi:hypothetical protein